jgi:hypothetical protein
LDGKALVGSMIGGTLTKYPFSILSLAAARKAYPSAQYLSFETGYLRDYTLDPFKTYAGNDKQIAEQASNISDKLDYKATILGFSSNSIKYALDINSVTDNTTVFYKTDTSSFSVKKIQGGYQILDAKGKKLDYEELYWFVWFDVNPGTILLQPAT